jgi:hypothetical protein
VERSKQDRAEVPCGTGFVIDRTSGPSLSDTSTLWDAHRVPDSEYESLMVCDFGQETTANPYPEIFLQKLEAVLNPKELAVVQFLVYGNMSLSMAGKYLGAEFPRNGVPTPYSKMAVTQIRNSAYAKLKEAIRNDAQLQGWVMGASHWEVDL